MKLYSRGQLVIITLLSVVCAIAITSVVCLKVFGTSKNVPVDNEAVQNEASENQEENVDVNDEYNLSVLQQNPVQSSTLEVSENYTKEEQQNIYVYEICNEAVVNINTKVVSYDWFLNPYAEDGGSGSGSIIDKRGYILTNVHVINGADKIYVSLFDGTQYEAKVIGYDLDSDLAIIKFDPEPGMELKTISFGDSTALKVGQRVIAIGNPFGLERTMTTGIVSSLGRPIQNSNNRIIRNMVQTDAAINPGNSGGPLLDTNGKMVGINTSIVSSSNSSAGVGFAVPSETAVRVVSDLLNYGKVMRGVIDAKIVQLNGRIIQYAGLDVNGGILVSEVTKGGFAEKCGLRGGTESVRYYSNRFNIGGDVITQIDNIEIKTLADYYLALESKKPGDEVKVIVRRNRQDVELNITLCEN